MRKTFILLFFLCILNIFAQDVIVKKDGSTILSKVVEVGTSEIKYKKWNNVDGPFYSIFKSDVQVVNYENGSKDFFTDSQSSISEEESLVLNTSIAENNVALIDLYNQDNHYIHKKTSGKALFSIDLVHVSNESVLNNTDLEMSFVPPTGILGEFRIMLKNLTNNIIYIDLGNSFRVYGDGSYKTYYSNTITQTTTGKSLGIGLNMGSVAGMLGLGNSLGPLASGINIGGAISNSTTEITFKERIIPIPPQAVYVLENDEIFWKLGGGPKLTIGEEIEYNEANSPDKKDYIFTYSKDSNFKTYATIKATLFLAKQIGSKNIMRKDGHKKISNFSNYTLWNCSCILKK